MVETLNTYGYRYLVAPEDAAQGIAVLRPLAVKLQRRRKTDGAPFLPLQLADLENQWNAIINFTQGRHPEMSMDAARACHEELARVFRFRARAYMETVREGRFVRKVRRIALEDIQLPRCECSGGVEHYDLCPDDALDAVREVMQQVIDATDAEEAHAAAWAADALVTALANHGLAVRWPVIWREVCPPLQRTIAATDWPRYQAWDAKWRITGEDQLSGELGIERDRTERFTRALKLLSERAAREQPRSYDPPADWQPPVEQTV